MDAAYDPGAWHDFAVAFVSASAALLGLVFVVVSLHLRAVVDDTVITGSFNFSNNATQNAENVLQIESKVIADHYAAYVTALTQRYPAKGL